MSSPDAEDFLIVSDEEAGERLDKLLATRFKERYSRTYFQHLIEEGLVLLEGEMAKKRDKPKAGDEIEVQFAEAKEIDLLPEAIPLDILYEDAYLLAINKPVGMVVHPAPGNWKGTFVNALLHHCQTLQREISATDRQALRPGIVHRLDKETSGVLLAAKTAHVQQKLTHLFASRAIYKEYIAICIGHPPDGEVATPIGRHPTNRKQMAVVTSGGKLAVTKIKTLGTAGPLSCVSVRILTGRTHQIRVHLKHLGTPILGDPLYGNATSNKKHNVTRPLLHASLLRFDHPITGEKLEITAPIPPDMAQWVKKLCSHSHCV